MNKFLITNKPEKLEGKFKDVKVLNTDDFKEVAPESWSNYDYEFMPYLICENIKNTNPIIAIDFSIPDTDKYLIAHHIITSVKSFVFFFSEAEVTDLLYESDLGLFRNKFIKVITSKNLVDYFNNDSELERLNHIYNLNFDFVKYKIAFQQNLSFDRHQATNEWGAIKLLLNHGVRLSDIESQYKLPKTIYFKQKLKEHNIDNSTIIDISTYLKKDNLNVEKAKFLVNTKRVNKILLIDDNSNRGWRYALKVLFNSAPDIKLHFEEANSIVDFSIYDLIFLDLRLPTNLNDTIPNIDNGFKLIDKIKADENSLNIPLIIFTASQKASTLNDILEAGADAMYVKESPDLTLTESLDNYFDFISEINFQIKKGEHLKKYWEAIKKIKQGFLPEIINSNTLKLKSRIIERLEMFYGLIKKKYEQSSYNDKKFHFSSDVLSFMTLWSIFNEIQECYFQKGNDQSYTKIKDFSSNPPSFININLDNWKLKNQTPNKYYVVEKPIIEEDISASGSRSRPNKDYIRRDLFSDFQPARNYPFYEFDHNGFKLRRVNYKEKLSLQIAFIILAKNCFKSSTKINNYLSILKEANEQRNKLYITHGEESSSTFHTQLEKVKTLPTNATVDLFSLIAFVLTGDDSII